MRGHYSKHLSEQFNSFIKAVCRLAPKTGVEIHWPSGDEGSAVLYSPVRSADSADIVYDPYRGRWNPCGMLADTHTSFYVYYFGQNKFISPVSEAGEQMNLKLPVETPADVAEVLEFYHDAKANCRRPMRVTQTRLSELLDRYFVLIWVNRVPRLLPLDDVSSEKKIPAQLLKYLAAFLAGDFNKVVNLGGDAWDALCKKHARILAHMKHEPVDENDLCWCGTNIQNFGPSNLSPIPRFVSSRTFPLFPMFVLRPAKKTMANMFCAEYFGYTSEGVKALSGCLKNWSSLADLRRYVAGSKITVPNTRMGQIRYAIELRATRYALEAQFRGELNKPVPFANAVSATRANSRKLKRLR